MIDELKYALAYIRENIDEAHVAEAERLQGAAMEYGKVPRIPVVFHDIRPPEYKTFSVAEGFADRDRMLVNELLHTYVGVKYRDDRMLTVRAQFGPGIIPSMFGCKVEAAEATTWTAPYRDSAKIKALVSRGMPDINSALGGEVYERQHYFNETLRGNGLDSLVHQYQADNQSPFDLAEMIWGEDIYVAMYDEPELVHEFLALITDTTIKFVKNQKRILNESGGTMCHWWYKVKGGVRFVDDMTTNISPRMYDEFVIPYNERIFAEFGGGYMHFCGFMMHNQPGRIKTKGNNGMELVEDRFGKTAEHKLNRRWSEMAPHRQTVYWVGYTLDGASKDVVSTGCVFGYSMVDEPPGSIAAKCEQVREYWVFD